MASAIEGMGGAAVGLASDVTAGYWNPAGLAHLDYPQAALMHAEQFGSLLNYDYGVVAFPVGPRTTLGLSVMRLGVDDIPDTRNAGIDAAGNFTADPNLFSRIDPSRVTYFNAADWALLFSYATVVVFLAISRLPWPSARSSSTATGRIRPT